MNKEKSTVCYTITNGVIGNLGARKGSCISNEAERVLGFQLHAKNFHKFGEFQ